MFEPHRHHCVVSLSKNINPSLVLVQPRKTHTFITERLLIGRKESNQTNKLFLSGHFTQILMYPSLYLFAGVAEERWYKGRIFHTLSNRNI